MAAPRTNPWTDFELLRILDLRAEGKTMSEVARIVSRETCREVGRNAVIGIVNRVTAGLGKVADTCAGPENRDGGMGPGWWREGIRARRNRA